jgi:hypothetical protein
LDDAAYHALIYDYDGDGLADVVTCEESGHVIFYKNLGGGVLSIPGVSIDGLAKENMRSSHTAMAFGDITGDGLLDLVVATTNEDRVIAYRAMRAPDHEQEAAGESPGMGCIPSPTSACTTDPMVSPTGYPTYSTGSLAPGQPQSSVARPASSSPTGPTKMKTIPDYGLIVAVCTVCFFVAWAK